jgi:hypothetical protein
MSLDFVFPYEKPTIALLTYVSFYIAIIFLYIDKFSIRDIRLSALLAFTTLYSTMLNLKFPFEQFVHVLKVLLPMFFLLSLKNSDLDFELLRKKSKKVFIVLVPVFLIYFFGSVDVFAIYEAYENNPTHTVAQNIAKVAFLYMTPLTLQFAFMFAVLVLLNVRSNILPFLLLGVKDFLKSYGAITKIVIIVTAIFLAINVSDLVDRFLFKGRIEGDFWDNFTSGRFELLLVYFDYIVNNFSFLDYILGVGNLNIQGIMRLSAHNDLVNVFVEYGLLGIFVFYLFYRELYLCIDPKYKAALTLYFVVVFFTNGILFHQSNVLFVLYLKSNKKVLNAATS